MSYPQPKTPLPWLVNEYPASQDNLYIVRAANSFPHLVAALEAVVDEWGEGYGYCEEQVREALAIASGEIEP